MTEPLASAFAFAKIQNPASAPAEIVPVNDRDEVCWTPTWTVIDADELELSTAFAESTATKW